MNKLLYLLGSGLKEFGLEFKMAALCDGPFKQCCLTRRNDEEFYTAWKGRHVESLLNDFEP
jgi:hypothetical protein